MGARPDLTGQVAVVTGASSGIGRDLAVRLRGLGATVVGCARDVTRMDTLGIDARRCDLADAAQREALAADVLADHGRVDVLVNNAGIGVSKLVEGMTGGEVERLVATNCTAVVDLTRMLLPQMLDRRSGHVVTVSSGAAWVAMPPLTVYCATKSFVDAFTEGLRREAAGRGVRVHSVNPGPVRTEWLPRSMGYDPQPGSREQRSEVGVPTSWVVDAVVRCLSRPYGRTASVPRLPVGLARLLAAQPLRSAVDVAGRLAAERLRA